MVAGDQHIPCRLPSALPPADRQRGAKGPFRAGETMERGAGAEEERRRYMNLTEIDAERGEAGQMERGRSRVGRGDDGEREQGRRNEGEV